jgi:Bacteriocin-protection, YdeI or OmpD-Associated/Domain of unknown function (DUF1905)
MSQRFDGVLHSRGGGVVIELPFDPKAVLGRARAPVRVTINDFTFRTTVAVYGGVALIGLNKANRAGAGVDAGDRVTVEIEPDTEPREVELPPELATALAADTELREFFDGLSYTHRREYAEWIAEAKREETRERRAARAVELLRERVRTPK